MNRLTEFHGDKAVIKDKARLPEAMAELAAYESAYKLQLGSGIELVVPISDRMLEDYKECERRASCPGPGKECAGCSLDVDVFGSALCEYPTIAAELLKRIEENKLKNQEENRDE